MAVYYFNYLTLYVSGISFEDWLQRVKDVETLDQSL